MRLRAKHGASVLLVLSILVSGYLWAANRTRPVEVNEGRLSVHVDGMTLGELLVVVEEKTGVQFKCDEVVASEKIYLDFTGHPLSEGIEKIIYPWNSAAIYDDAGKLRRVIILGRGKDAGLNAFGKRAKDFRKTPQPGWSETGSFTQKGNSKIPGASKNHSVRKGPPHVKGPATDKPYSIDGPPKQDGQVMEGPPLDRAYLVDGPPSQETVKSEGRPDAGKSGGTPAPDARDPLDGPPLDRPYEMDGPPGWGDKVMEGPPGA
jgi:hypothetical protein